VSRVKGWLGTGFLVVAAIAVGLLLTEAGLRLIYPQQLGVWHQDRDGLGLHWPGLVAYMRQSGVTVSYNSAGMRDREHTVVKPEGVFRVLVLGDSFMEAHQVPFEASFPSLVERELGEKTGKRVEVVNASVSGWGTDHELKYLTSYGMEWKPDLIVVVMTLHNDISDNLEQRFHTIRNGALVDQPPPTESFLRYPILQVKAFLATKSHAWVLLRRARREPEVRVEASQLRSHVVELLTPAADEQIVKGLDLTTRLLARMQALASSEGSRVVVVLLPLAVQVSNDRFVEFARSMRKSPRDFQIDKPQRMMTNVGDHLGLAMIDLLPGFQEGTAHGNGPFYLEHDGHWNARGHKLAADLVADALIERHLLSDEQARSTATSPSARR